ncbi:MAG: hypothetical protein H8D94_00530 [Candidatus Pelagibacter sp.]|nr:hypothetical protein [Candidatus Pelagibacter sp.]
MDIIFTLQAITLALCWFNYIILLYTSGWDFADTKTVGWCMAVLGWTNVVF